MSFCVGRIFVGFLTFYLQDAPGRGYWFPCQLAGGREFGQINDHRPILMRGDNFKVPEKPTAQRYVAEHLKVTQDAGRPLLDRNLESFLRC